MKKTDFKKLAVGQRVTVTGKQDSESFEGSVGAVSKVSGDTITVNFDIWDNGWGGGSHSWAFDSYQTRNFNITVIPDAPKVEPKPKKRPHGAQEYKGNGKHEWEKVTGRTVRLRVPGGWLYGNTITAYGEQKVSSNTTFVPVPQAVGYSV